MVNWGSLMVRVTTHLTVPLFPPILNDNRLCLQANIAGLPKKLYLSGAEVTVSVGASV
jgi:hypothetical protein